MKPPNDPILITGGGSRHWLRNSKATHGTLQHYSDAPAAISQIDRVKAAFPKLHPFEADVSDPKAIAKLDDEVTKHFPDSHF